MAMQTIYFKEHEGLFPNTVRQLSSSIPTGHWRGSAFGSQSLYGDSCGQQLKPLSMEQPGGGGGGGTDQFMATKQVGRCIDFGGPDRGNKTQFTIFPGDYKFSGDGQKSEATISLQSSLPEYHARFELGFSQPMVCAKYPYIDQFCGVISYGRQIAGRIMLPLNLTADDGPIYVNAKQYHGIIRRRQSRAKAAMLLNKLPRPRKPYMHESRHLHAMRRPRGCGGRFLNTKNVNTNNNNKEGSPEAKKLGSGQQLAHPPRSPSSEILESESGTLNSSKEANNGSGSNISGTEVTSMYTRGDLDHFQMSHHLGAASLHPFAGMIDIMPTKWIAAADHGCCNIKV